MCWGTDFREFLGRAKQHDNPDFVLRLGCRWPKRARWVCGCVRACVGVRVCVLVHMGKEPLGKRASRGLSLLSRPLEALLSLSSIGL